MDIPSTEELHEQYADLGILRRSSRVDSDTPKFDRFGLRIFIIGMVSLGEDLRKLSLKKEAGSGVCVYS